MYIALLTTEQQDALCRIIQFIADVDGHDDHRESMLQASLLEESHLEHVPGPAESMAEIRALLPGFASPFSRRALLVEAFGVALADQVAHPKEIEVIQEMAKELDLSDEWLDRARDFVQRTIELQHEGRDLLGTL